jgi:hypothetical protein
LARELNKRRVRDAEEIKGTRWEARYMSDDDNKETPKNPLEIADLMKKDLAKLESFESRKEITDYLKDQFVAKRLEASSKQERLRNSVIDALIARIEDSTVPLVTLLKILEVTNKGGEIDLSNLLGGGKGQGLNVQINNNQQQNNVDNPSSPSPASDENSSSPVKDLGFMLDAMKSIAETIPVEKAREMKEIIDVTPVESKTKDDK